MSQKRQKFKIATRGKTYDLSQSPFYKLNSKKKLSDLLLSSPPELKQLTLNQNNYNVFSLMGKNGKSRVIEHPNERLDQIHTRIASLLCRLETPSYIESGIKGKSHISNAKIHQDSKELLTSDIRSFFASTSRIKVFNFFYIKLRCSTDVADLLSKLCTYQDHVPTGSRISMPLAVWANVDLFNELNQLSIQSELKFSVYVDDITFSGDILPSKFENEVKRIVRKHNHRIHPKKTKLYRASDTKIVTGVAIKDSILMVKNQQHMNLYNDMSAWLVCRDNALIAYSVKNRLIGRLNSLAQIDRKYKDKARSVKNYKQP